jgi:hypothetical protein
MSRRVLLRTKKLFTIPTPYLAPRGLLPVYANPFSYSNSTAPYDHTRAASGARRRPPPRNKLDMTEDPLRRIATDLTFEAFSKLKAIGISRREGTTLLGAARVLLIQARGVRFVFDCLNNRGTSNYISFPLSSP